MFLTSLAGAEPPIPVRIGGSVTVGGSQLTQATDTGSTFKVTAADGAVYVPATEDIDGLNSSDWYIIDVPLYDATDQPGGVNPGETAVSQVYKDGIEWTVSSPVNGQFAVGLSGSTTPNATATTATAP